MEKETTEMTDKLLHDACKSGNKAEFLGLLKQGVDPNSAVKSMYFRQGGKTPLHYACQHGWLDVVEMLVDKYKCNPQVRASNQRNTRIASRFFEITPLDLACEYGEVEVVKLLIERYCCDPNQTGSLNQTPVHYACECGKVEVAKLLIQKYQCNCNVQDSYGRAPLHHACQCGQNEVVLLLVNTKECNLDIVDKFGRTALHYACEYKYSHIVKNLIEHGADPNVADNDGNTAIYIACRAGELDPVKCLLSVKECDPNTKNKNGLTPLDVTPTKDIVVELIKHGANPTINTPLSMECMIEDPESVDDANSNDDGNTSLHKACATGNLDVVKRLITKGYDPNAKNKDGLTPLQVTSPWYSRIIKELIDHGANPNVTDSDGNTPLHTACQRCYYDAVKNLLTSVDCNPNAKNKAGRTPLMVTSIRDTVVIRELIRHGANANDMTSLYKVHGKSLRGPLQPPVKVFVVGDPSVGKSTLTAALQKESTGTFFQRQFKANKKITGVDTKTAGVVPYDHESKVYGYATFYDFAGQREFYGSHATVLQNIIQSSPPVFITVADLSKSNDKITKSIFYWLTFLENQCTSVTSKPHVIVVGSHADVLTERGEDPESKISCLKHNVTTRFSRYIFAGFITIDCQYPESRGMNELRRCLKESCSALRIKETISFNAHCFYVYLIDNFKDSIAITIEQIQAQINMEDLTIKREIVPFIPDNVIQICKICDELNNRGHILFLKDSQSIEHSWVVIDKKYLLEQVSGSIFAPEHFEQHKVICSSSTGVVLLSSIASSFPDHNPELLIKFLSCLEFCHEISDTEVLHHISADLEHQKCIVNQSVCEERYYLFPALVGLSVPKNVWGDNKPDFFHHHFGWMLCCENQTEHFFTSRFLQVLLLRIAFAFPLSEGHTHQSIPSIQRNCSIWKNGIFWGNECGVETLIEMPSPDNNTVIVLMRCGRTARTVDMVQLRSQVICQVLKAASEFCGSITTVESFIDPSQCKQYPIEPLSQLRLFPVLNTSKAILDTRQSVAVVSPTGTILLEDLIQFEPYAGLGEDILWEIFENQDEDSMVIPDSFLSQFSATEARKDFIEILIPEHAPHMAHINATTQDILVTWRTRCAGTYKCLKERLDEFSIFAGRSPLALVGKQKRSSKVSSRRNEPEVKQIPAKTDKPTLKLLQTIKSDKKNLRVKVIESVAAQWEQLAIALGFDPPVIDYLRRDFSHDSKGAATKVLTKWLNGESDLGQPITWDTLIQCLEDAEHGDLAEVLAGLLKDDGS